MVGVCLVYVCMCVYVSMYVCVYVEGLFVIVCVCVQKVKEEINITGTKGFSSGTAIKRGKIFMKMEEVKDDNRN